MLSKPQSRLTSECSAWHDRFAGRIFGLDFFRFMAITLVLIAHSKKLFWYESSVDTNFLRIGGYWGVELFFVLSGFLVGRILINTLKSTYDSARLSALASFWKRRWFRTLPLYYVVLSAQMIFSSPSNITSEDRRSYYFFLQNFSSRHADFFPEAWSLSIEEIFYLSAPILLVFLIGCLNFIFRISSRQNQLLLSIVMLVITFTCLRFQAALNPMNHWDHDIRRVVIFRLDAIMIGVLAAWFSIYKDYLFYSSRVVAGYLGVILSIFSAYLYFNYLLPNGVNSDNIFIRTLYFNATSVGFMCFLPIAYYCKKPPNYLRVGTYIISFISITSYSIYLTHNSIILPFLLWLKIPFMGETGPLVSVILYLALTLIISYFTYTIIEEKATKMRDVSWDTNRCFRLNK
jgi:peptidoglycan/LPS O-acetylase OafA/YrhL